MVAAECLRHFRDPQKWPFPEGKIKYVEDVFALLGAITGDAIFEQLLEEHRNMEDLDMKNSFERVRNFYRSEGFDLGERSGEMRGIKLGEERGERQKIPAISGDYQFTPVLIEWRTGKQKIPAIGGDYQSTHVLIGWRTGKQKIPAMSGDYQFTPVLIEWRTDT